MSDYPESDADDVVYVSSSLEGGFTGLLSIQVGQLKLPYDTREQFIQRLCELVGSQCLVPDDGESRILCG